MSLQGTFSQSFTMLFSELCAWGVKTSIFRYHSILNESQMLCVYGNKYLNKCLNSVRYFENETCGTPIWNNLINWIYTHFSEMIQLKYQTDTKMIYKCDATEIFRFFAPKMNHINLESMERSIVYSSHFFSNETYFLYYIDYHTKKPIWKTHRFCHRCGDLIFFLWNFFC